MKKIMKNAVCSVMVLTLGGVYDRMRKTQSSGVTKVK